jgi:hypothetical protein
MYIAFVFRSLVYTQAAAAARKSSRNITSIQVPLEFVKREREREREREIGGGGSLMFQSNHSTK